MSSIEGSEKISELRMEHAPNGPRFWRPLVFAAAVEFELCSESCSFTMVGAEGFEPPTLCSQSNDAESSWTVPQSVLSCHQPFICIILLHLHGYL